MKKRLFILTICFVLMLLLPVISAKNGIALSGPDDGIAEESTEKSAEKSTKEIAEKSTVNDKATDEDEQVFRILDTDSGEIREIPDREFCIGALAYELAPSFETEALKAQTVVIYTHFCRLRKMAGEDEENSTGADFSADMSAGEFYYSDSQLREKWGDMYDESIKKLRAAVDEVFGYVLTDENGELIDAAYHAISSGVTENAEDIFGKADSHLISAASPGDCFAPDYMTKRTFTADEFLENLKELNDSAELGENGVWGEIKKRTAAGTVLSVCVGGCDFTGNEIRQKFSLRSADFDLEYSGGEYTFTVRGYGHGVGMSQWGAQAMAQQGAGWREIVCHYYHDALISEE